MYIAIIGLCVIFFHFQDCTIWPISHCISSYISDPLRFPEALGYEKGEEGYEKDGINIKSLKVNGALALLFLVHPELDESNMFEQG